MGFSRVASLHLVPLVARIALCAVFVPIGWNKILTFETFTGKQATAVRAMLEGPGDPTQADAPADAPADTPAETPAETPGETGISTGEILDEEIDPITARKLYGLAVMLEEQNVPRPLVSAWLASAVELVGGGLLLIGLLTRIWALGLAFAMGVAFTLTSLPIIQEVGPFGMDLVSFNRTAAQIGLGSLAIGLLLSGPGGVSIDHGIFGSTRRKTEEEKWDDVDPD